MQSKASVAVVILAHNESLHLPRALEHVAKFANEVFVVDSGSADNTVEIARRCGAQVLEHPFQNYARQFEWALANAPITSDWVMRLDADEVIEDDLADEIIARLPQFAADVTGVNLNRKTIFQGKFLKHGGRYPLWLLRIWRRGKAHIEDRWMDEHMVLDEGRAVNFRGGFADHNLHDLTFFIAKHNGYASREALDVLNRRMHLFGDPEPSLAAGSTARQASTKRFIKEAIYNRIPFEMSATAYFLYRYIFQLGFLDGRAGLVYHVLQGFWYRFLVGAKVRELKTIVRRAPNDAVMRSELARATRQRID
ncbi:MAG TPA: glycosyltransferase family 2 protein [Terracidiphilus sp.]|nr:glycosyltransferase family 2 protein [Terracidiphilus sp.]